MTHKDKLIAEVVAAAGGRITGRVRLQKIFYLLDHLGLGSGFRYEYHHYGPYSADLSESVADATAFGLIKELPERRASDGVGYSVYEAAVPWSDSRIGCLDRQHALIALDKLQAYSSTVLELAATIHWLRRYERRADWETELRRRKGIKAEGERMPQALHLLHALGLH